MEIAEIIRGNLRRRIADSGYPSIERFAHENGIDKTTLSRILSGQREPKISTLFKIAESLNLTLNDLYLESGGKTREKPAPVKRRKLTLLMSGSDMQSLQAGLPSEKPMILELRVVGKT